MSPAHPLVAYGLFLSDHCANPNRGRLRTTATVALDTQSQNDNNNFCDVSSTCVPAVKSLAMRSFLL